MGLIANKSSRQPISFIKIIGILKLFWPEKITILLRKRDFVEF